MPREKMHWIEKNKVKFPDIQNLLELQKKRNEELKDSGYLCDLKPKADKKACETCTMFKTCTNGTKLAHKAISDNAPKKGVNRRRRKQNNPKKEIDPVWVDEDIADSYAHELYLDEEELEQEKAKWSSTGN